MPESYEYCKCICGQPIVINSYLPFENFGGLIASDGTPLYFCEHAIKHRGEKVLLTNGREVVPSELVHAVCCILLCEKEHSFPCSHRLYEGHGRNLREIILQNKNKLKENPEEIKELLKGEKIG